MSTCPYCKKKFKAKVESVNFEIDFYIVACRHCERVIGILPNLDRLDKEVKEIRKILRKKD